MFYARINVNGDTAMKSSSGSAPSDVSSQPGRILYDWPGGGCEPSLLFSGESQLGPQAYDVTIVGAGIVGCALAFALSRYKLKVLLLDKNYDVSEGISKGNSAIIHTGFDATPGSLESRLVTSSSVRWPELAARLKIPFDPCGAMLLAVDDEQAAQLPKISRKACENGVLDTRLLSAAEARALEPNAPETVHGGLLVPRESIIDPFTAAIALAEVALANGTDILLGVEITAVEDAEALVKTLVSSTEKRIRTRILVNVAGLASRALADCYGGAAFDINPRRGQFLLYDKCARSLVKHILLPVPTPQTKGMLVIPTIFGNLVAGPTAEDLPLDATDATDTTCNGLGAVQAGTARLLPCLSAQPPIAAYAGARCNCAQGSYIIRCNDAHPGIVTVTGVRSTGLTAAPALADHLIALLAQHCGLKLEEQSECVDSRAESSWPGWWKRPFDDTERLARQSEYGRIVCTCENISLGEIGDALDSPLKPRTLDAIKRRTRTQMGRCQGFECLVRVAEIISATSGVPLEMVTKKGPGSELLSS